MIKSKGLNKKWLRTISISFMVLIPLLLSFQNCSNVELSLIEAPPEPVVVANSIQSQKLCTELRPRPIEKYKFVFVVDLSASNLGSWTDQNSPGYYFWDPSQATDILGNRFNAIEAFINTIGDQDVEYLIVGFTGTYGKVKQAQSGNYYLDCSGDFVNKTDAQMEVAKLHSLQAQSNQFYSGHIEAEGGTYYQSGSTLMSETGYTNGLQCAYALIADEFLKDPSSKKYQLFFLSDGQPEDPPNIGCNVTELYDQYPTPEEKAAAKKQCYLDSVEVKAKDLVQLGLVEDKTVELFSIFYGKNDPTAEDLANVGVIAEIGGTKEPLELTSFADNLNVFENLVRSSNQVEFEPQLMYSALLTSVSKNGVLKADSDMDGIADEDEFSESAKTNPRSQVPGILDKICELAGGRTACQALKDGIKAGCSESLDLNNSFHFLTECDVKVLQAMAGGNQNFTNLVDFDEDGVSNYIEIIKNLNPFHNDVNLDPDGDGISNIKEISLAKDPNFFDKDMEKVLDTTLTQDPEAANCKELTSTLYSYRATLAFRTGTNFGHDDLEEVIYQGALNVTTNLRNKESFIDFSLIRVLSKDPRHFQDNLEQKEVK